jgi:hypothetical protein
VKLGIAAESRGDAALVTGLGDRLLQHRVEWTRDQELEHVRSWVGTEGQSYLDLHQAPARARQRGLPVYGSFGGEPGAIDALMHRAILLLFAEEDEPPEAVVIARDTDGDEERPTGLEQAKTERSWPFQVIGAIADPEIEAWSLAIWQPETEPEHAALAAERQTLGFDPTLHPERLSAGRSHHKSNAKRVLGALTTSGRSLRDRWAEVSVDHVLAHPSSCGLSDFAREFVDWVGPQLGAR